MVHPFAGAIGLAVLCLAGVVLAADDVAAPIVLKWTAPVGCLSQQQVRAEIDRLLGGPPDPSSARYLRAEAEVSRVAGDTFRLRITTDMGGAIGRRELDNTSCAALSKAAALIVALTFDPEAVARQSPDRMPAATSPPPAALAGTAPAQSAALSDSPAASSPSAASSPLPALPPSTLSPVPPPPAPAAGRFARSIPAAVPPRHAGAAPSGPTVVLGAAVSTSIGALPSVGFGIGGGAGLLLRRFRVDVSAAYWPDRRSVIATRTTAGGDVRLFAAGGRACYAPLLAPVELAPCAGLEIGSMSADGFGVAFPGGDSVLWIAPLIEGSAALPLGRHFALRLDIGALLPLLRPTFVLERVGLVHRASVLVGRAVLAAEARF